MGIKRFTNEMEAIVKDIDKLEDELHEHGFIRDAATEHSFYDDQFHENGYTIAEIMYEAGKNNQDAWYHGTESIMLFFIGTEAEIISKLENVKTKLKEKILTENKNDE